MRLTLPQWVRRSAPPVAAIFAAIIAFALLPGLEAFEAFSMVIGLYLVPAGALMAQPWQRAMFASHGRPFHPASRARKPDELRHRTIL